MEGLTLLREAQEAGLEIAVVGDSLEIVGPKSAGPIVERIRQHKAEVLAALLGCCSPTCARCAAGTVLLPDGCETHHITPEMVGAWWALAQERDAEVTFCHCCAGPAPSGALVCRRCEGGEI